MRTPFDLFYSLRAQMELHVREGVKDMIFIFNPGYLDLDGPLGLQGDNLQGDGIEGEGYRFRLRRSNPKN